MPPPDTFEVRTSYLLIHFWKQVVAVVWMIYWNLYFVLQPPFLLPPWSQVKSSAIRLRCVSGLVISSLVALVPTLEITHNHPYKGFWGTFIKYHSKKITIQVHEKP